MNEFPSESTFLSSTCLQVQQSQPRYPTNTIIYIPLYHKRFIILFTQIIHKQTQKIILQYGILKSTAVQYNSWHTEAGGQVNWQEDLLTGGGGGGEEGRAEGSAAIGG